MIEFYPLETLRAMEALVIGGTTTKLDFFTKEIAIERFDDTMGLYYPFNSVLRESCIGLDKAVVVCDEGEGL